VTSTPERSDDQPTEHPDRSSWTTPLGHTDYAPLSGSGSHRGSEQHDYRPPDPGPYRPPDDPGRYRPPDDPPDAPPPVRPVPETRSTPTSHRAGPTDIPPTTSRGVLRHLLGLFVGLALTPCAIGLLVYGGYRYSQIAPDSDFSHDTRGLVTLGAGALALLLVACSGALSPVGPLVGALWGLAPAGFYLLAAESAVDLITDLPRVPAQAESGAVAWLAFGCFLAVGVTLLGTFVATAARPRR
jgi:hypothetical protein